MIGVPQVLVEGVLNDPLGADHADVLAARIAVRRVPREGLGEPHEISLEFVALLDLFRAGHPKAAGHRTHILVPRDDDAFGVSPVGHPHTHEVVGFEAGQVRRAVLIHEMLAELGEAERLALVATVHLIGLVNVHAERPRGIAHGDPEVLRVVAEHPRLEEEVDPFLTRA